MTLANPLRMRVILTLEKKQYSVLELSKKLKVEQSKLSHALSLLRKCNIVQSKIMGKQRLYSLNKETIVPMLKNFGKHRRKYCRECKKYRTIRREAIR